MIVAYRNVTREMLVTADTVIAIEPDSPCDERVVYRKSTEGTPPSLLRTSRVVVVLLDHLKTDQQFQSLRAMVKEAKSRPGGVLSGEGDCSRFADSLEWIQHMRASEP